MPHTLITVAGLGGGVLDDEIVESVRRKSKTELEVVTPHYPKGHATEQRADLLRDAILKANKGREDDPDHSIVIYAVSAGGFIARYALARLVHEGVNHRVKTFVARDSPILGALVPMAFQALVRYMPDYVDQGTKDTVSMPLAKELLMYYLPKKPNTTNKGGRKSLSFPLQPDPARVKVLKRLRNWEKNGPWLGDIHCIGISNGSNQKTFSQGIFLNFEKGFIPTPYGKFQLCQLGGYIRPKIIELEYLRLGKYERNLPKIVQGQSKVDVTISGKHVAWENAPGSFSGFAKNVGVQVQKALTKFPCIYKNDVVYQHPESFIPTASALGINHASPTWIVNKTEKQILKASLFDEIRLQKTNRKHGEPNKAFIVPRILKGF
jgi:hypothetical protein